MSLLNQTNFPRLWRLFQWTIGGGCHKRSIVRDQLGARKNVLEVGCSVGNIAEAFRGTPDLHYTGVDIDQAALQTARRSFRDEPHFQFLHGEIEQIDLPPASFDFVVLSAVLHHVDDDGCRGILHACAHLLAPNGVLLVTEPVLPIEGDPWLVRFFNSIEQGKFVRASAEFTALMESELKLRIVRRREFFLQGSPLGFPRITRCMTLELRDAMVELDTQALAKPSTSLEDASSSANSVAV